jgi:hypothetical protein
VNFTLLCPHNFVLAVHKLQLSCLKVFALFCIFLYCTVGNFYNAHDISIQLMCIVELISKGDGQIMETLDSIGIKLFVCAVYCQCQCITVCV